LPPQAVSSGPARVEAASAPRPPRSTLRRPIGLSEKEWDLRGCVITLGSRGAFILDRSGSASAEIWVEAHQVETIDTVGAGDAFCGSLAAGALLPDAVRLANAARALSTTVSSAAASAPDRSAALALLNGSDPQPSKRSPFPVGPPPA
jgi:ribokinase